MSVWGYVHQNFNIALFRGDLSGTRGTCSDITLACAKSRRYHPISSHRDILFPWKFFNRFQFDEVSILHNNVQNPLFITGPGSFFTQWLTLYFLFEYFNGLCSSALIICRACIGAVFLWLTKLYCLGRQHAGKASLGIVFFHPQKTWLSHFYFFPPVSPDPFTYVIAFGNFHVFGGYVSLSSYDCGLHDSNVQWDVRSFVFPRHAVARLPWEYAFITIHTVLPITFGQLAPFIEGAKYDIFRDSQGFCLRINKTFCANRLVDMGTLYGDGQDR